MAKKADVVLSHRVENLSVSSWGTSSEGAVCETRRSGLQNAGLKSEGGEQATSRLLGSAWQSNSEADSLGAGSSASHNRHAFFPGLPSFKNDKLSSASTIAKFEKIRFSSKQGSDHIRLFGSLTKKGSSTRDYDELGVHPMYEI